MTAAILLKACSFFSIMCGDAKYNTQWTTEISVKFQKHYKISLLQHAYREKDESLSRLKEQIIPLGMREGILKDNIKCNFYVEH